MREKKILEKHTYEQRTTQKTSKKSQLKVFALMLWSSCCGTCMLSIGATLTWFSGRFSCTENYIQQTKVFFLSLMADIDNNGRPE